jgi:hypothetical protein
MSSANSTARTPDANDEGFEVGERARHPGGTGERRVTREPGATCARLLDAFRVGNSFVLRS